MNSVSPNFPATMGIPFVAGHAFSETEMQHGYKVAVVNQTFVRQLFAEGNPIGMHFALDVLRTNKEPGETRHPRDSDAVQRLDTRLPVSAVATMDELIDGQLFAERSLSLAASVFAVLACALAGVGLYGVMAYMVAQRRREFGIRLAVGATPGAIARMVLGEGAVVAMIGLVLGLPCVFVASKWGRDAFFGLHGMEAGLWAISALGILLVTLLTAWVPARMAAGIDPQKTLREE